MKTHILITLIALVVSACASQRTSTANTQETSKTADQYSFREGQGSHYR